MTFSSKRMHVPRTYQFLVGKMVLPHIFLKKKLNSQTIKIIFKGQNWPTIEVFFGGTLFHISSRRLIFFKIFYYSTIFVHINQPLKIAFSIRKCTCLALTKFY